MQKLIIIWWLSCCSYLGKRAHPDLQTAMSFLMMWVVAPDEDNWKKLAHCIQCICDSKDLYLMLETTNAITIKWWIDTSCSYHAPGHEEPHGRYYVTSKRDLCTCSAKSSVSTQKAWWKQNLSESMTVCHWWSGLGTSYKCRDSKYETILFSRIIRVVSC
jgi:hypothetical protein